MDRNLYQKLLVSLKAGERWICADGGRDCGPQLL